jgi:hypothetical protein
LREKLFSFFFICTHMERTIEQLTDELQNLCLRVAQLKAAAANGAEDGAGAEGAADIGFRNGDKVLIKNKLKRPATWPTRATWDK